MVRKHVPIEVTTDVTKADLILQANDVANKTESGRSQLVRCAFLDCVGAFGSSAVSVTLTRRDDSVVLWAYQVRKNLGGPLGYQSLSEAIAKHLKNDYLDKHPPR